jgi:hypothetical protein
MRLSRHGGRRLRTAPAAIAATLLAGSTLAYAATGASAASPGANLGGLSSSMGYTTTANLAAGSITHVWLIILENKSYNAEFTGLNGDTYLWQTLPSQGVLLQNYYGTGHTSQDNYISVVSGQAPQYDVQSDCSNADTQFSSNTGVTAAYGTTGKYNGTATIYTGGNGGIVNAGPGGTAAGGATQNWAYGQAVSTEGPNTPIGTTTTTNGCTYPTQIATLFDQFNQAGVTWKGYAQDLNGSQQTGATSWQADPVPGRDNGPCGAPGNADQAAENPVSNPTFLSGTGGFPIASTLVSSTATGGTTTSLTDSSQSWTANQYANDEVVITGGTGVKEFGTITANTATTLTLTLKAYPGTALVAPDTTSTYVIGVPDTNSYTAASLVAGTGTGPDGQAYSLSNPQYSDQYVAKHFPFAWFESLSGVGGSGTTALTTPANGGTNCDANHISNLDDPSTGLVYDLNHTSPNFSWITPNNCSDGHDAACKGNNLSGAFGLNADGTINLNNPIYTPSTTSGANCTPSCGSIPSYDPEATTPRNFTGGTYAADLFLAYYVPLIEHSPAFQHGLIDVTFDEGEPSFLYGGNTFNNIPVTGANSNTAPNTGLNLPKSGTGTSGPSGTGPEDNGSTPVNYPPSLTLAPNDLLTYGTSGTSEPGATSPQGADNLFADSAGESFYNAGSPTSQAFEPTGPNSPLVTDSSGNQVFYGPGFNLNIHRPPACTAATPPAADGSTGNCVSGEVAGAGSATSSSTRADAVTLGGGAGSVTDTALSALDTGREVTSATIGGTPSAVGSTAYDNAFLVGGNPIASTDAVFVGNVTQNGPAFPATSSGSTTLNPVTDSFQLVDANGNAVTTAGGVSITSLTLSGECDPAVGSAQGEIGGTLPSTCSGTLTPDPQFDATDPTAGGGDTGSVLISPYIKAGTTSTISYNHYSWLRTMEDLFNVGSCAGGNDVTLTAGSVCGGLDSQGHLGYAAQTDLNDFGLDVFSAPNGSGYTVVPESPLAIALPLAGIVMLAGFVLVRRSRRRSGTGTTS